MLVGVALHVLVFAQISFEFGYLVCYASLLLSHQLKFGNNCFVALSLWSSLCSLSSGRHAGCTLRMCNEAWRENSILKWPHMNVQAWILQDRMLKGKDVSNKALLVCSYVRVNTDTPVGFTPRVVEDEQQSTLAKCVDRFRNAPPTSRDEREEVCWKMWWREEDVLEQWRERRARETATPTIDKTTPINVSEMCYIM